MKNLYINIGNTNTTLIKIDNVFDPKDIKKIKTLDFEKYFNVLKSKINEYKIEKIYICSTKSDISNKIKKEINNVFFIDINKIDDISFNKLDNKKELGQDILAQLMYIKNKFDNAIVISLGTATVIYSYKNKTLEGCIILPGIYQNINTIENTTDIKDIRIVNSNKILGTNTNEAISIGILKTIKNFVEQIKDEKSSIIYTGGNSQLFINESNWIKIDNLELVGLIEYSKMK